jgi:hypothetical protein
MNAAFVAQGLGDWSHELGAAPPAMEKKNRRTILRPKHFAIQAVDMQNGEIVRS